MVNTASLPSLGELNKMTVPALKALCKGRITGCSKLTKAVMIQRLTEVSGNPTAAPSASASAAVATSAANSVQSTIVTQPTPDACSNSLQVPSNGLLPEFTAETTVPVAAKTKPAKPKAPKKLAAPETSNSLSEGAKSISVAEKHLAPLKSKETKVQKTPAAATPSKAQPMSSDLTPAAFPVEASELSSGDGIRATQTGASASNASQASFTPRLPPGSSASLSETSTSAVETPMIPAAARKPTKARAPKKPKESVNAEGSSSSTTKSKAGAPKKTKEPAKEPVAAILPVVDQSDYGASSSTLPPSSDSFPVSPSNNIAPASHSLRPSDSSQSISTATSVPVSKKRPNPSDVGAPVSKKAKTTITPIPPTVTRMNFTPLAPKKVVPLPDSLVGPKRPMDPSDEEDLQAAAKKVRTMEAQSKISHVQGKRFQKLVVRPKVASVLEQTVLQATSGSPTGTSALFFLECWEPLAPAPTLSTIPHPPRMNQRKLVPATSHAFSFLGSRELSNLALVNKLFRYAVYTSSQYQLKRTYGGKRLDAVLGEMKNLNCWPYLRQRKREMETRKRTFDNTFLAKALRNPSALSDELWASEDDIKVTICLRFFLTRLWFMISLGTPNNVDALVWSRGTIVDARESSRPDVWRIRLQHSEGRFETFHVVKETCEVLGTQPSDSTSSTVAASTVLRSDWSDYIFSADHTTSSLKERIKWTNHEDYERGIARGWLHRVEKDGELGMVKRVIAERYILGSVLGNSVSGKWMSSTSMENEFQGLSHEQTSASTRAQRNVQIFLPPHHHVESVHFDVKCVPLHPALAVVQTPSREYHVLRGNGMQVGCEEDGGVAKIWMEILGCSSDGLAKM